MSCKPQCKEQKVTSTWLGSFPQPKGDIHGTEIKYNCLPLVFTLLSPPSAVVDPEARRREVTT